MTEDFTPDSGPEVGQHSQPESTQESETALSRLEALERHGQLTNASDQNDLAALRGQEVYEPPQTEE